MTGNLHGDDDEGEGRGKRVLGSQKKTELSPRREREAYCLITFTKKVLCTSCSKQVVKRIQDEFFAAPLHPLSIPASAYGHGGEKPLPTYYTTWPQELYSPVCGTYFRLT